MAVQVTGTYGTGIGPTYTHIIKKLLEHANPKMPVHQFVQKRWIPLNTGKTAQFTRLLHIAPVTSPLTEGSATTPGKVYAQDFTVSVEEWGKAIACSTLLDDTFINPALDAHIELLGINAGESMQLELQKTLWGEDYDETTRTAEANVGCIGLTWFATADAGKRNVLSTADSTGTTTTYVANDLNTAPSYGDNNDTFLGASIVFTNPQSPNYGLGRRVYDSTSSSPTITWKTAVKVKTGTLDDTNLTANLETARLSSFGSAGGNDMTQGTDILSAGALRRAVGILRKESAEPYSDPYFVAVVSPESYDNLLGSTSTGDFVDIHKYTTTAPLLTNECGRLAGCRIVLDNKPYKLSASTPYDYSSSGTLHVTFVLGKNALGACGLQGQLKLGVTDTNVIIKRPGPQTVSLPLNEYGTAGWKTTFGRLSLNACSAVGIVTYPSAL